MYMDVTVLKLRALSLVLVSSEDTLYKKLLETPTWSLTFLQYHHMLDLGVQVHNGMSYYL